MRSSLCALALCAVSAQAAQAADQIPYPCCEYNTQTYTVTATTSGDITAYFAGSAASYDNQMGMPVDDVLTSAGYGLDNHTSTIGQAFDLGPVTAGAPAVPEPATWAMMFLGFVMVGLGLRANIVASRELRDLEADVAA